MIKIDGVAQTVVVLAFKGMSYLVLGLYDNLVDLLSY